MHKIETLYKTNPKLYEKKILHMLENELRNLTTDSLALITKHQDPSTFNRPSWPTGEKGTIRQLIQDAQDRDVLICVSDKYYVIDDYTFERIPVFGAGKDHINSWKDIVDEIQTLIGYLNKKELEEG